MKILAALLAIVLLIAVVLLALPFLVDLAPYQDQYKPLIEEALNRKIQIKGIRLTIWPRIGARVEGFTVLDDPAFQAGSFASLSSLDVGIKLRPLLSGNVDVEEIVLRQPVITVLKNQNGILNVSTIGPKAPASAARPEHQATGDPLQALAMLAVDRVAIEDGHVTYRDLSAGQPREYQAEDLQFALNSVRLGERPTVHMSSTIQPQHIPVALDGSFGPLVQTLEIKEYDFKIGLGKVAVDARGSLIGGKLNTTVSSPSIRTGDIPFQLPLSKPAEIRDLLIVASAPYPLKANVPPLELGEVPNMHASVVMGQTVVGVKASLLQGHAKLAISAPTVNTADLPVEAGLTKPVALNNVEAQADYKGQAARLSHLSAQIFGGQLKAEGLMTTGAAAPPFQTRLSVKDLQLGQALEALQPDAIVSVKGSAVADLTLAGRGFSKPALTQALEGSGHVDVRDGKLEGLNLMQEVAALLKVAGISIDEAKATVFSTAETDFAIKEGIVQVRKLLLDSHNFQAAGGGSVGFDQRLNLAMSLNLSPAMSQKIAGSSSIGKLALKDGRLRLPLLITGTVQDPAYALDMKMLTGRAQEQLEQKAKETVKGLLEGTTKPKDLKKQGEDLLKGLFGR